jgi:hypothetical protein
MTKPKSYERYAVRYPTKEENMMILQAQIDACNRQEKTKAEDRKFWFNIKLFVFVIFSTIIYFNQTAVTIWLENISDNPVSLSVLILWLFAYELGRKK